MKTRGPEMFRRSYNGSAFLMVIGALALLGIVAMTISRTTVAGRWSVMKSSHEKKAEECAEAAMSLTYRLALEGMNDMQFFYKALQNPANFFTEGYWFTQVRMPAFMAGADIDGVQAKSLMSQAVGLNVDLKLNLSEPLVKALYDNGIKYHYEYDSAARGRGDRDFVYLEPLLESMGGRTVIDVQARINRAFAIMPKSNEYEVGGITHSLSPMVGLLGKLFDSVNTDALSIDFDLLSRLSDENLIAKGIEDSLNDVVAKFGVPPIPIPIGQILNTLGITRIISNAIVKALGLDEFSLRGLAKMIFDDKLTVRLDLTAIKDKIQNQLLNCLPQEIRFLVGKISWGITIEKIGSLEVRTKVEYTPAYPGGPTIRKVLVTEREFRVTDIQPVAPDHTFFVANSDKLYEDDAEKDGWTGDKPIDWNAGDGSLMLHNFPTISQVLDFLGGVASFDLSEMAKRIHLPGLVRVNGTSEGRIQLSFTLPFSLDKLKKNEISMLAMNGKDVIPKVERTDWNFWGGDGWDWPYFQGNGWWIPMIPSYNRTFLFGNFDLEVPFSLRVEGNLTMVYNHLKILMVNIWVPPIPPFFPGFGFVIPWMWATEESQPYGFENFPPTEDGDADTRWDPNNPENLPPNLYSTSQYLKKSNHFYNNSQEFWDDYPNRCKEVNGKQYFLCDGVTFINNHFSIVQEMQVMGRGMIVAAGNIHVGADVRRRDEDHLGNTSVFSLVARNGGVINNSPTDLTIEACVYADRGLFTEGSFPLTINGNLVVNRFNRSDCQGDVHIVYNSKHTRSSPLSLVKPLAKWDPSRFFASMSGKYLTFEFIKN